MTAEPIAFILTTANCGGLIPTDMLRAGGRSGGHGGGRGR